ncbi:unnamed protein product, partial [marine sediment metagenome]
LELNHDQHDKWFLHIDTFDPHEPWDPPKWYADLYDPDWKGGDVPGIAYVNTLKESPSEPRMMSTSRKSELSDDEMNHIRALYAGEVTLVDRWVGKLLQKIGDLGLLENTMVIFTTDHGSYHGEHDYLHKRAHLYEEVAHIPLLMRLPDEMGDIRGRCNALVQPPDLMPTILDFAGAKIPETIQGESLSPIIRREKNQVREVTISSQSFLRGFLSLQASSRLTVLNLLLIIKQ